MVRSQACHIINMNDIGENVYQAEKISKKRSKKGRDEFFVKWKGWSTRHSTWEPKENILDQTLIDMFEAGETNSKRKGRKQKRQRPVWNEPEKTEPAETPSGSSVVKMEIKKENKEIDKVDCDVIEEKVETIVDEPEVDTKKKCFPMKNVSLLRRSIGRPRKKVVSQEGKPLVTSNNWNFNEITVTDVNLHSQNVTFLECERGGVFIDPYINT
nr:chromobox protein homolog 2-like [Ciona intestinalis]|eukprot:XP_026696165.1 chromobox protein homolog 2-like [Ciona intestinalis]